MKGVACHQRGALIACKKGKMEPNTLLTATGVVRVLRIAPLPADYCKNLACFGVEAGTTVQIVRRGKGGPLVLRVDHFLFSICRELAQAIEVTELEP